MGEPYQDSHFLLLDTDILPWAAPWEDANTLAGGFSVKVEARSNPLRLVYLVIPDGETAYVEGTVTDASGAEFRVFIPEPCTLSLLAIGGMTLIRRRRKA